MSQTKMYFNTTRLSGRDLRLAIAAAKSQNEKIFMYFKNSPGDLFSPSHIHKEIFDDSTPIVSIRRAITTLTSRGLLAKTNKMVEGYYGAKEHCWKLN